MLSKHSGNLIGYQCLLLNPIVQSNFYANRMLTYLNGDPHVSVKCKCLQVLFSSICMYMPVEQWLLLKLNEAGCSTFTSPLTCQLSKTLKMGQSKSVITAGDKAQAQANSNSCDWYRLLDLQGYGRCSMRLIILMIEICGLVRSGCKAYKLVSLLRQIV